MMAVVDCGFENRPNALALRGPTLYARIGFEAGFQPEGGSPPNLPAEEFPVLVDTGANNNGIDIRFAMELGLPIIEQQRIVGVQGLARRISTSLTYTFRHCVTPSMSRLRR